MTQLIQAYNWSDTSIGAPRQWSTSLRTLVMMMLASRFPMLIFWGPELITFYNDAFRPSLGEDGKHPSSLGQRGEESWAESWPTIGPMIYSIMAGGQAVWFEDQKLPLYRDGQMGYAYWTYSFSPVVDDNGVVNGVLVTCSETTKAVENLQRLNQSNADLQQLLDQHRTLQKKEQALQEEVRDTQRQVLASFEDSPVGIALISGDELTFRLVNPFYGRLVNRKPEELIGKPMLEALPELAGQGFDDLLRQVLATGVPFSANEVAVDIGPNNQLRTIYVDMTYQPRRDRDGPVSGILVVATDVTQQVLARRKIEHSEARFRALIEEASVATCLFIGREMVIDVANETMLSYWGKGRSVFGKPLVQAVPELVEQPFLTILDQVFTSRTPYRARNMQADLEVDGVLRTYYFDFTYKPLLNADGDVYGVMDTAVDVTEQVLARQLIVESEERLRGAMELADIGAWQLDMVTGITTYSERLKTLFEFSEQFVDRDRVYQPIHEQDRHRIEQAIIRASEPSSSGLLDEEYTIVTQRTHRHRLVRVQGKMYFDAAGKPLKMVGSMRDITEERQMQQELKQQVRQRTEELAAANEALTATNDELLVANLELNEVNNRLIRSNENLQQFAYVASHDLQEPLRKIQTFGALLQTQHAAQLGEGIDYVRRMQVAAARMSTLIQDLLTFSRISTERDSNKPVALKNVVDQVLTDLDMHISETGTIIHVGQLPTINGDALQLGQLFQNLISNAIKFRGPVMAPVINIQATEMAIIDLPQDIKLTRLAQFCYRIDVVDNGIGFDQQYAERIFQVFQRLHGKSQYAGTGIGLAICRKVAVNHGGVVIATSQPGQGATFSVYLPV